MIASLLPDRLCELLDDLLDNPACDLALGAWDGLAFWWLP